MPQTVQQRYNIEKIMDVEFASMTSSGMEGDHSHHGDGDGNSFCHGEMGMVMYVR
jgi:hypothetical protein